MKSSDESVCVQVHNVRNGVIIAVYTTLPTNWVAANSTGLSLTHNRLLNRCKRCDLAIGSANRDAGLWG
jgi:hypothetical protein